LFQVQPLLGKAILPWFGGGASVWTVCMLFFQSMLLAGYAYSHWLTRTFTVRWQVWIHLALLLISLAFLPALPSDSLRPDPDSEPASTVLLLMLVTIGLPFFLLAASSPLIQYWYGRSDIDRTVYRLYALSNLGSLLGLLTYPFLLEPLIGLTSQSLTWSALYIGFAGLSARFGWRVSLTATTQARARPARQVIGFSTRALWIALPMCASLLLLATTNRLTLDVAPIPLLWVLPLTLYLMSFIITFHSERWYDRRVWVPVFLLAVAAATWLSYASIFTDIRIQVALLALVLFATCMICHGELFRLRPDTDHLTGFYLHLSLGGALGGVFVAIVAPLLFNDLWEFHLGLLLAALLLTLTLFRSTPAGPVKVVTIMVTLGSAALAAAPMSEIATDHTGVVANSRNFYGVVTVMERNRGRQSWRRDLWHGSVRHGAQYMAPKRRRFPTVYFGPNSGGGLAIRFRPGDTVTTGLKVGAVGLGVGTISTYLKPRDRIRFYEIDPQVIEAANEYFTFVRESQGDVEIVPGDARLSMTRELSSDGPQAYDVLLIDAFSSDSIPVHLLTREAFELYWRHLKSGGILAVHTTAVHTAFEPLVRDTAHYLGKKAVLVDDPGKERYINESVWIVVTNNQEFLELAAVQSHTLMSGKPGEKGKIWTDDYSNLLPYLKW
jgi:hypothetical protein